MGNSKTNRRNFIRKSALSFLGLGIIQSRLGAQAHAGFIEHDFKLEMGDAFTLPPLRYRFDQLEPNIDAMTMEIHYSKHHAAYVKNLNDAVSVTPELQGKSLIEIVKNIRNIPEGVRTKVRNNAGGHWNHSFFWQIISNSAATSIISDELRAAMISSFNDMDNFKAEFNKAATGVFGSGWAWLVKLDDGSLQIGTTPNQDNPLMDISPLQGKPILGVDVWEHAYYLKYQNRRAEYLSAFWNVVDWNTVSENFSN